jgi:hypothetical protein
MVRAGVKDRKEPFPMLQSSFVFFNVSFTRKALAAKRMGGEEEDCSTGRKFASQEVPGQSDV